MGKYDNKHFDRDGKYTPPVEEKRIYILNWVGHRYEVVAILRSSGNVVLEGSLYCQDEGFSAFRTEDGQHYRSRGQRITRVAFRWSSAA